MTMQEPNEYRTFSGELVQAFRWMGSPQMSNEQGGTVSQFSAWGVGCVEDHDNLICEVFPESVKPGEWIVKHADGNFTRTDSMEVDTWELVTTAPDGWDNPWE